VSETESFNLVNYPTIATHVDIVYNLEDNQDKYNVFYLYNVNDVVKCEGIYKSNTLSYELVLNHFVGICVHNEIDHVNKMYIVYSRQVTNQKLIRLKNKTKYHLSNSQKELEYYPIVVICCQSQHDIEEFVQLYPYLVKNIFNYNI